MSSKVLLTWKSEGIEVSEEVLLLEEEIEVPTEWMNSSPDMVWFEDDWGMFGVPSNDVISIKRVE